MSWGNYDDWKTTDPRDSEPDYDHEEEARRWEEELAEEGDLEIVSCPACGGTGEELGRLGNRLHYRCVCCGMDFSMEVPK